MPKIWSMFWIGLNDVLVEGDFEWSSGVMSSFFNWADPEELVHDGKDCTAIHSNVFTDHLQWNNQNCSTAHSYICERRGWQ